MTSQKFIEIIIFAVLLQSCKDITNNSKAVINDSTFAAKDSAIANKLSKKTEIKEDTINTVKLTDYNFLGDSLFHGHKALLKYYFQKYYHDTCIAQRYPKKYLKDEYEGIKYLGYINNNKQKDSVLVLRPFSYCDLDGQSYYFTDTALPRLETDSYCCHPSNIFLVGDIDEDGVEEIGQFYSSCVSHYKSLYVYSLKNRAWKEVGHCFFDLFYMDIGKPFSYFIKKIKRNKFSMLEITDLAEDKSKMGKRNWKQFSM